MTKYLISYILLVGLMFGLETNAWAKPINSTEIYHLFVNYRLDIKNHKPNSKLESYFTKECLQSAKRELIADGYKTYPDGYKKEEFNKLYRLRLELGRLVHRVYAYNIKQDSEAKIRLILQADTYPIHVDNLDINDTRAIITYTYVKENFTWKLDCQDFINRDVDDLAKFNQAKIIDDFE